MGYLMARSIRAFHHSLLSSSLLLSVALAPIASALAFDVNAGSDTAPSHLPNPAPIYAQPTYAPSTTKVAAGYISPLPPLQMPGTPLYPDRVSSPLAAPSMDLPPVSPEVAAKAQNIIAAEQSTVAPPPAAEPAAQPLPTGAITPSVVQAEVPAVSQPPKSQLSSETRAILNHVTGNLDAPPAQKGKNVAVNRVTPEIKDLLGAKAKEDAYESVGLSIKVRRPGLDVNYELNRAYTSLMGGDTTAAIETYKNILSTNPRNEDALFGLAATYHRLGNLEKARPLYGMLLQVNPNHREGLNNFLVLVSDESPQDALPELQRLESRNPAFSPIPAQTAIVLDKMGYKDEAREKMLRAIELAPDNLTYKYNLAVMLDHQGNVADASALYRLLIDSSLHGEKVPATADAMQRRLNYLTVSANDAASAPAEKIAAAIN